MTDLPDDDLPPPSPSPATDEPMTPRLLARLFVVPLLIVAMIVGSSVLVVLLFGWISTSQQESVEKLISRIEAGSGDKILGVALLPKDKEVWQAAMELAKRLEPGHPKGVTPEQKPGIAQRLEKILEQSQGGEQHEEGQQMQQFMLTTLGSLGQPTSVDVLVKYATDSKQPPPVRASAIGALVLMRTEPAAREAIPALIPLLEDPDAVVRVTTTVAIGALAKPDDPVAISALGRAYHNNDRDMSWNAALALAKLQSNIALPMIKDMLTRKYWDAQKVELPGRQSPTDADRHLTTVQIESYLMVAIDAAVALHDSSLQPYIQKLTEDPSLQVRDRARKAIERWSSTSTSRGQ